MKQKEQNGWNKSKMNDRSRHAPISGLNNNLEVMGKQLHIQTESTRFPAVCIVTQVFCGGRVILSRKTNHTSSTDDAGNAAQIRERMNSQHSQVINEIKDKLAKWRETH
jgi:hypothetical protein